MILIAHPLTTKDSRITLESAVFHTSVGEDKQSVFLSPHTESKSKLEATDSQSVELSTDSGIVNEFHTSATNAEVSVSRCGESVDESGSPATYTSLLDKKETTGMY